MWGMLLKLSHLMRNSERKKTMEKHTLQGRTQNKKKIPAHKSHHLLPPLDGCASFQ